MCLLPFFPCSGNVFELFFQVLLIILDIAKMLGHCTRIMAYFEKWTLASLGDHLLLVFLLISENLTWSCCQLSVFRVLRKKTAGKPWKNISKWGCEADRLKVTNYSALFESQTSMLYEIWSRMMQFIIFIVFWDLSVEVYSMYRRGISNSGLTYSCINTGKSCAMKLSCWSALLLKKMWGGESKLSILMSQVW